jgi:hypothetical protein
MAADRKHKGMSGRKATNSPPTDGEPPHIDVDVAPQSNKQESSSGKIARQRPRDHEPCPVPAETLAGSFVTLQWYVCTQPFMLQAAHRLGQQCWVGTASAASPTAWQLNTAGSTRAAHCPCKRQLRPTQTHDTVSSRFKAKHMRCCDLRSGVGPLKHAVTGCNEG